MLKRFFRANLKTLLIEIYALFHFKHVKKSMIYFLELKKSSYFRKSDTTQGEIISKEEGKNIGNIFRGTKPIDIFEVCIDSNCDWLSQNFWNWNG